MSHKLLCVIGTRPEYIKCKPLIHEAVKQGIEISVLLTGQHEELLSEIHLPCNIIREKFISPPTVENRLNDIIRNVIHIGDKHFKNFDYILVQGDTASAYAAAQCAKNLNKKVIHLEAGLRTYDFENPNPEERFRQCISRIADIHFCPTDQNYLNIVSEFCGGEKFVVGNTAIDNLGGEISEDGDILCTLHRRENLPDMENWFKALDSVAKENTDYKFVLPLHPSCFAFKPLLQNVTVVNPLSHEDVIKMVRRAPLIISDSGGLQEEASFFNKKIIVCRKKTERPEAIGRTSFMCADPGRLKEMVSLYLEYPNLISQECPFGDGLASKRICKILKNEGL